MELWEEKPITLKFRLGELTLFSWQLPAQTLSQHFTELPSSPKPPEKLLEDFQKSLEVIVMRSHPVEAPLSRLAVFPQTIRYVPVQYKRYWIELTGEFNGYLKKFSAKSRNTLTRKIKKFKELSGGEISWREYLHPNEMAEFHHLAIDVSGKTYQERLLGCGLPDNQSFCHEIQERAGQGLVRGYILFFDTKPIAYIFCPIHDGVVIYEYVGHDPEFKQWSPGTILQYLALERLFESGKFRIFDFTEGEGAHKAFFATHNMPCADIYYFRRTLRNLIMLMLHAGIDSFSNGIAALLEKMGLKTYLKKFLRSAA